MKTNTPSGRLYLLVALLFIYGCQGSPDSADTQTRSTVDAGTTNVASPGPTRDRSLAPTVERVETVAMSARLPQSASELCTLRTQNDKQIWSNEVFAQQHESTFVALWDALIHEKDKYQVFRKFRLNRLIVATIPKRETLDWQISRTHFAEPFRQISLSEWPAWVTEFEEAGYQIVETEFHHSAFQPSPTGATSDVSFVIHAKRASTNERFVLRGTLKIRWQAAVDPESGEYVPDEIDATDVSVMSRQGNPAFVPARVDRFPTDPRGQNYPTTIHPVMLQDLNEDGLPEIIVGGFNHVYVNRGDWKFDFRPLCEDPIPHVNAAAFADFDGDGILDYMAAAKNGLPVFYKGSEGGRFSAPPQVLKVASERLPVPISLVPGDIDGDGDLDVFIGQQKPGYSTGDIPIPYYDARDSFPSYLLRNNGHGNFTDITIEAGLSDKRLRRNFAASLIDYDEDGDLDLIMTSDFSGTDIFENDGHGHFRDVTDTLEPNAYAFGMSHTFGDYNLDGKIDFLTVGMSSTTARRLEKLQLGRADFQEYDAARMKMGYGNRMFLFQGDHFIQAPFNQDVARTGWSWGSTTLDFDNDADPDVYVVNGQTSGQTTKDYCTSFWCHDLYFRKGERPNEAIRELFSEMAPQFNGHGISWNGYEHNALLMNQNGQGFVNVAFLMNVSFEFDSRTALSGDIDGDGLVDLVVEHKDVRENESKLYIVRNVWDQGGHWIGVHLRQTRGHASPFGARVTATLADGRVLLQHNVAGHSVWAQHANTVHFGLGDADEVVALEVHWPDGTSDRIPNPQLDRYHVVDSGTAHSSGPSGPTAMVVPRE